MLAYGRLSPRLYRGHTVALDLRPPRGDLPHAGTDHFLSEHSPKQHPGALGSHACVFSIHDRDRGGKPPRGSAILASLIKATSLEHTFPTYAKAIFTMRQERSVQELKYITFLSPHLAPHTCTRLAPHMHAACLVFAPVMPQHLGVPRPSCAHHP